MRYGKVGFGKVEQGMRACIGRVGLPPLQCVMGFCLCFFAIDLRRKHRL